MVKRPGLSIEVRGRARRRPAPVWPCRRPGL